MDMIGLRRSVLANGNVLPPMYKSVDYVVSTAQKSYIDTGVSGTDDTLEFECTFLVTALFNYAGIFGNYTGSGQKAWRLIQGTATNWMYANCHSSSGSVNAAPGGNYIGVKLTAIINTNESILTNGSDSIRVAAAAKAGTETGYNIAIGKHAAVNPNATTTETYQTWFYGFKISSGGILIRDYIPCLRMKDGVAGMWDKVSKKFCPSDSIHDFGYGYDT